jgi:Alcohol dehydrogenase, class IV
LLHSLSYPLTGYYNVSHGLALGYFLPKISKLMNNDVSDIIDEYENFTFDFNIDMEMVIDEALKYDKINESKIFIDKKVLQEVLV